MCLAASWMACKGELARGISVSVKEGAGSPETMTVDRVPSRQTKVGKTRRSVRQTREDQHTRRAGVWWDTTVIGLSITKHLLGRFRCVGSGDGVDGLRRLERRQPSPMLCLCHLLTRRGPPPCTCTTGGRPRLLFTWPCMN